MTVLHSIRLRFVGWLDGICDEIAEKVVEHLRRHEVEAQAGADHGFTDASFGSRCGEGHVDDAVEDPRVQNEVGAGQGYLNRLHNSPLYIAYAKRLAASNNDLINHQNTSFGKDYLASLNPTKAGVEP